MTLLAIPLLILLPGLVVALAARRSIADAGHVSVSLLLLLIVMVSVMVSAWYGLLLAASGVFSLAGFAPLWIALAIAAGVLIWRDRFFPHLAMDRWDIALAGLLVASGAIFFRPAETIFGGTDPAVYLTTGVAISKSGGIFLPDPETPRLSAAERSALYGNVPDPWHRSGLPGFIQADFRTGSLEPQGFHLYPVWLAIGAAVGGVNGALNATPFLALLAVWAIVLIGRRFVQPAAGILAGAFLTLNAGQVWFARAPSAEAIAEPLLLTGILVLDLALAHRSRLLAAVGGAAFGLAHLAKIDLVMVAIGVVVVLGWCWAARRWRPELTAFLAAYIVLLIQTAVHAVLFAPEYLIGTVKTVAPTLNWSATDRANPDAPYTVGLIVAILADNLLPIAVLALAALALIGVLVLLRTVEDRPRLAPARLNLALVAIVIGVAVYAYYVRPISAAMPLPSEPALASVVQSDRESLVRLGLYVTPIGLAVGVLGYLALILSRPRLALAMFLLCATLEAVLFLARGMITPVHFWAARRYVPLVFPALALAAATLCVLIAGQGPGWRRHLPGAALAAVLFGLLALNVAPYLTNREYLGAVNQVADLNARLPANAVVIVQWRDLGGRLTTPLALLHDRTVFSVEDDTLNSPGFVSAVRRWTAEGRPVVYLHAPGAPAMNAVRLAADGTFRIRVPTADSSYSGLPKQIVNLTIDVEYGLLTAS